MKKYRRGGSFARMTQKCQECELRDKCDNKKTEACAYFTEPLVASVVMPSMSELTQPILEKHDYMNVKVAENTTITIDVEELKKKIADDVYNSLGCGLNYGV